MDAIQKVETNLFFKKIFRLEFLIHFAAKNINFLFDFLQITFFIVNAHLRAFH